MFDPVGMPLDFLVSMFAAKFKLSRIQVAQSMAEACLISLSIENRCSLHPGEIARWIESLFNEPLNSCDQLRALIYIRRQSQTRAVETVSANVLVESLRMGMLGDKLPSTDQLKDIRDFVDDLLVYVRTKAS